MYPFLGDLEHPRGRVLADVARRGRGVATHLVAVVQSQGGYPRELLCLQDGSELVHSPLIVLPTGSDFVGELVDEALFDLEHCVTGSVDLEHVDPY